MAKGAALTRLYENFVVSRPVKLSRGLITLLPVTPEIRRSPLFQYLDLEEYETAYEPSPILWYYAVQWLSKKVSLL